MSEFDDYKLTTTASIVDNAGTEFTILPAGTVLEAVVADEYWMQVKLPSGRIGFVVRESMELAPQQPTIFVQPAPRRAMPPSPQPARAAEPVASSPALPSSASGIVEAFMGQAASTATTTPIVRGIGVLALLYSVLSIIDFASYANADTFLARSLGPFFLSPGWLFDFRMIDPLRDADLPWYVNPLLFLSVGVALNALQVVRDSSSFAVRRLQNTLAFLIAAFALSRFAEDILIQFRTSVLVKASIIPVLLLVLLSVARFLPSINLSDDDGGDDSHDNDTAITDDSSLIT